MADNFGMVGGAVTRILYLIIILIYSEGNNPVTEVPSPNAVFDIAWSEAQHDVLVSACGDGFIRVNMTI